MGAGAGFSIHFKSSINTNRKLRKRSTFPDTRTRFQKLLIKEKLNYNNATPEQLAAIRKRMRTAKGLELSQMATAVVISLAISILILWGLSSLVLHLM